MRMHVPQLHACPHLQPLHGVLIAEQRIARVVPDPPDGPDERLVALGTLLQHQVRDIQAGALVRYV